MVDIKLNLLIKSGRTDFLAVLILLIHEHGIPLQLYGSCLVFLSSAS
jgi:hypothetical protein